MNIIRLTEDDAIELMADHVDRAIRNPEIRVFQILGYFGIGKRTAIRQLFERNGIEPVEHDYTILETDRPIVDKVAAYPSAVHVWDDVFRTNILYPDVLSALQKIQDGSIPFQGTFLLIANDQEFPDHGSREFISISKTIRCFSITWNGKCAEKDNRNQRFVIDFQTWHCGRKRMSAMLLINKPNPHSFPDPGEKS
jgi:hypothetical protein